MKKRSKILLTLLLVLTIFLGMTGQKLMAQPQETSFSDVPSDHPAYSAIMELKNKAIIQGYGNGKFGIDDPLTRAHVIVMLVRSNPNLEVKALKSDFLDVPSGYWAEQEIATAAQAGIIQGYGDGNFGPDHKLNRGQLAKMLANAFEIKSIPDKQVYFSDIATCGFAAYIDALSSNGIVKASQDNCYAPAALAKRGEFALYFSNCLQVKTSGQPIIDHTPEEAEVQAPVACNNQAQGQEMLTGINAERKRLGLPELKFDPLLQAGADSRAVELATCFDFEHKRPDGSPWYTVFGDQAERSKHWSRLGENIAWGSYNYAQTAQATNQLFFDSPAHYGNIINPCYDLVGLSSHIDENGGKYWVQIFAQSRNP